MRARMPSRKKYAAVSAMNVSRNARLIGLRRKPGNGSTFLPTPRVVGAASSQQRTCEGLRVFVFAVDPGVGEQRVDVELALRAGAAPAHRFRTGASGRMQQIGPVRHAASLAEVLAEQREVPLELQLIGRRVLADAVHVDDDRFVSIRAGGRLGGLARLTAGD